MREDVAFVLLSNQQRTLPDASQLTSQHDRVDHTTEISCNANVNCRRPVQLMHTLYIYDIICQP